MDWHGIDDTPGLIRELLAVRGLALKKRWGQNFMVSRPARERIVNELAPESAETVWEIGSGLGGITALLVGRARRVIVFEVDYGLMEVIRARFGETVRMVAGDAVKTVLEEEVLPDRIVGNLPYRSAAAIVTSILEDPRLLAATRRMVFTVQKEMARRMVAEPGSSDYSPFSVLCSVSASVRLAGDLSRGNFYPAPDVVSSIVVMEPKPISPELQRLCAAAARALFAQRRKTVANNAKNLAAALSLPLDVVRAIIEEAGISLAVRAERVAPHDYLRLAELLAARV
ncbi:MAG: 16S rRNA (adenine(1518)-N(6)/adenine(1519)-N(6))-dimethyltransferase RsmA [Spirochaetota bacterium]